MELKQACQRLIILSREIGNRTIGQEEKQPASPGRHAFVACAIMSGTLMSVNRHESMTPK